MSSVVIIIIIVYNDWMYQLYCLIWYCRWFQLFYATHWWYDVSLYSPAVYHSPGHSWLLKLKGWFLVERGKEPVASCKHKQSQLYSRTQVILTFLLEEASFLFSLDWFQERSCCASIRKFVLFSWQRDNKLYSNHVLLDGSMPNWSVSDMVSHARPFHCNSLIH